MATAPQTPPKKKRTVLWVSLGCLGVITLCCCTGGGLAFWQNSEFESQAQSHAELVLTSFQGRDFAGAHQALVYVSDHDISPLEEVTTCFGATPLGDLASFTCHNVDGNPLDGDANVECTVVSPSRGTFETTIRINSVTGIPYVGFVYFDRLEGLGPEWSTLDCATWSGSEAFEGPPSNRVRPPSTRSLY